jgi:hypothetical protein
MACPDTKNRIGALTENSENRLWLNKLHVTPYKSNGRHLTDDAAIIQTDASLRSMEPKVIHALP